MLRNVNDLKDFAIQAIDGTVGRVTDFYFDDETWVIRYLVVDTGTWLSSRKLVLISPIAFGRPNWEEKVLPVSITKEQVKNSPDIDTKKPVSRQHEIGFNGYYGYPYYWGGAGLWGGGTYPTMLMPSYDGFVEAPHALRVEALKTSARAHPAQHQDDDPHLRDCKAVLTYHVQAADGDIGHVQGLLVYEDTWAIRYVVVDTSNWWLGHQVLIAPQWIENVSYRDATVSVRLTQQAVKDAPPYDPAVKLDRQQEVEIHKHYGHRGYWAGEATLEAAASHL
jgi:PRC-barrel domain